MLPTKQGKCFFFLVSNVTVKLFFLFFLIETSVFCVFFSISGYLAG